MNDYIYGVNIYVPIMVTEFKFRSSNPIKGGRFETGRCNLSPGSA